MINVNEFKSGMTISHEGNIYMVLDFQHVKPGKGAAIVKAKLRNLRTGSIAEYTFNAGTKVEAARIDKKAMQFLYAMGGVALSSFIIFAGLTIYNKLFVKKHKRNDDDDLSTPDSIDDAVVFFIKKNKLR